MFNKDRFHNQLALNLGYLRIVNSKRINICIDDKQYSYDVMVSISVDGFSRYAIRHKKALVRTIWTALSKMVMMILR